MNKPSTNPKRRAPMKTLGLALVFMAAGAAAFSKTIAAGERIEHVTASTLPAWIESDGARIEVSGC
jgi:hypothetical protein